MKKLKKDEYVVVAWAEFCAGPGWSNCPVKVLIGKCGTNEYRIEYIQPDEQPPQMQNIYSINNIATSEMTGWAKSYLTGCIDKNGSFKKKKA